MKTSLRLPLLALFSVTPAAAQFSDNFDSGTSGAAWTTKLSDSDASANFAFDYSTLGIPSAPNSSGNTTVGLGFLVNQSAGVFQGISASPTGFSFAGDFTLSFDLWLNYVGPLGVGGSGSTQFATFGWGVTGNTAEWIGATTGIQFATTADGGSASDYRAYQGGNMLAAGSGAYAAGSQNNSDSYYSGFTPTTAPAAQIALYPGQTGTTDAGEIAFAWREVVIERAGNLMTWSIDGLEIASVSTDAATVAGDNIFLGMSDLNSGSSSNPNDFLTTAIYDNVRVVPEPASALLVALGGMLAFRRRRR